MGPNSFRNLTYAAVLTVVGALIYLIYRSSQEKRKARLAQTELSSGLDNLTDTLGSLNSGSSTAALPSGAGLPGDSTVNALDGTLSSPSSSPAAASTANDNVKSVVAEDPASAKPATSGKVTAASTTVKPKSPTAAPAKPKFDAGGKGDFMVVAGSFASADNANGLVAKLKKIGFTKAEVVKLENSSNVYVLASNYEFKGTADAAVRTLKANKVDAYVKKKSGEVYKASAPAAAPAASKPAAAKPAASPAAKPAAKPS